jgi:hypothetical protein
MDLENTVLSRGSQTQKATHSMITFIWNAQNRQIHRDRKQIAGWEGRNEAEGLRSHCCYMVMVAERCKYTENHCIVQKNKQKITYSG